jgi:hypothetical protein
MLLMLTPTKVLILVMDFLFHKNGDRINLDRNGPKLLDYVL